MHPPGEVGDWEAPRPADFLKPGDDDVEKIVGDLKDKGLGVSEAQIRHSMSRLAAEASCRSPGFERAARTDVPPPLNSTFRVEERRAERANLS